MRNVTAILRHSQTKAAFLQVLFKTVGVFNAIHYQNFADEKAIAKREVNFPYVETQLLKPKFSINLILSDKGEDTCSMKGIIILFIKLNILKLIDTGVRFCKCTAQR